MRVLLTEDDSVLASVVRDFLCGEGHEVIHATNVDEAHRLLTTSAWDVCIVDPTGGSYLELQPEDLASLRTLAHRRRSC
jgi:DNA-binding response OmpR family regulator